MRAARCRLTNELFLVGSFNSGEHMSCVLIKHQTDSLCIDYAAGRDGRVCKMFIELFVVSLWSFKGFLYNITGQQNLIENS